MHIQYAYSNEIFEMLLQATKRGVARWLKSIELKNLLEDQRLTASTNQGNLLKALLKVGAKPLSEPMRTYGSFDPQEQTSMKF